jgi:hypothetical protein
MMAVLEQGVFHGLRAAHEQTAEQAGLFLGDPLAAAVAADKDDGGRRTIRWRFDELHVGIPSMAERQASASPWLRGALLADCREIWPAEGCLTHAAEYHAGRI